MPVSNDRGNKTSNNSEFKRPTFTPIQDIIAGIKYLIFNSEANKIVIPVLLLFESIFLKLIIKNIPYTEIDYEAYMEQIAMIEIDHNLNYLEIRGGTGPLVYPAGHVMLFKLMHTLTNGMDNIKEGQIIFRYLYLVTLLLQMCCYYILNIPPWCVVLACISKRLHSIYVLRLFNDCFTTFFMVLTIFIFLLSSKQKYSDAKKLFFTILSSITYSIAVSIKMNALLYFPAVMISLYLINEGNLANTILNFLIMLIWQIIVALPFLKEYPYEYLKGSFNFGRQFMFKWSINWQFLGGKRFHDIRFHYLLLFCHIIIILVILLREYPRFFKDLLISAKHPFGNLDMAAYQKREIISYTLITFNFTGIIFSRSLHYQFLCWYHWTLPIMIFWSQLPIYVGPIWYILHEYCWNSYPPNTRSSTLLICLNIWLLFLVLLFRNNIHHSKALKRHHTQDITDQKKTQ
ncbi:hypothetical protein TBLA_0D00510 [Henningerozyma blattae CBS 6284]|uniref:Dol-P-Man:Man(5)GlcNAc(2)-PP-Dol alpha-1,3-mannosyltransferase n=1 Tax=Henningerozyma blattae (strain ATCC 34711 / CBS 6284 / DSM 70876 / NBRC 10599 / NRRL Y-10934 / UCD 77-7) TaxID=1071380 RepID=I2H2F8_HENB6|nr:hypothetical protein TBLA_0D00510 [Tetrapisispora blattae CBS 6284]CCH60560.1 hypothetical protein TBLA_0D00510 [Tetrapisispora blattae CBS 6284]